MGHCIGVLLRRHEDKRPRSSGHLGNQATHAHTHGLGHQSERVGQALAQGREDGPSYRVQGHLGFFLVEHLPMVGVFGEGEYLDGARALALGFCSVA